MQDIKEKLKSLLRSILDQHQVYLVDLVVRNERGGKVVQVFVDTDVGITIEQCAEVSRELADRIELERAFETTYRLEVSSPGIDKPVRLLRQYHKNIGRRFKVIFETAGNRSTIVGALSSIDGDVLTFAPDKGEPVTIRFPEIIESKEELPW